MRMRKPPPKPVIWPALPIRPMARTPRQSHLRYDLGVPILERRNGMKRNSGDALEAFSEALVARAEAARALVVEIRPKGASFRSGTLWRPGIVVASEQSL